MKIDLHTHTTASDGLKTPDELVAYAIENEIKALAIADHDTIDGLEDALKYAAGRDIEVIPGIEFSVNYEKGTFHLVGLYIDWKNRELVERVNELARLRASRAERIVDDLNAHGIAIKYDEVVKEAAGGAIGKPHVARVLVRHGYAEDPHDVYRKFLEEGLPGHVKKEKISAREALRLIQNAGGISILAHPASLNAGNYEIFEKLLKELIPEGLDGIEAYSDMHSPEDAAMYKSIAKKYGLLVSGGSDYHGDKGENIGFYKPGEVIPHECYDGIMKYREGNK